LSPPGCRMALCSLNHTPPEGRAVLPAYFASSSGVRHPRAPSMAQRAWMTSASRKRAKVSGSAERPTVSHP